MKRLQFSAVFVLFVAFVAFPPISAQNQTKRPMGLEDILAFRAIGQTVLSNNGQWIAYRMSPIQGDSELIVRNTTSDKEMRFPVGEGAGGAVTFSDDSTWLALTVAPTRRESQAAQRTRRTLQPSVILEEHQ